MGKLAGDNLIFNAGVVGVSFFFVLSGFILTYNYADTFRNGVSLVNYRRFVWDRLTKIYPVHVLALLLVMPIAVLSPNLPLDWRALPFHLLLLQCFWPAPTPPFHEYFNVPSWSISCEWFFYLLAPMTMFFAVGTRRPWVPLALLASYAAGAWWLWAGQSDATQLFFVSWFAPSRFVEFVAGVFLGRFYLTVKSAPPALSSLAQVLGVALIVTGAVYRADAPWPLWGGMLYVPGSVLLGTRIGLRRWTLRASSRPSSASRARRRQLFAVPSPRTHTPRSEGCLPVPWLGGAVVGRVLGCRGGDASGGAVARECCVTTGTSSRSRGD